MTALRCLEIPRIDSLQEEEITMETHSELDRLGNEIAELSAHLAAATAEHVERIVRGWRHVNRHAEMRETVRQHVTRALHVYPDDDGTVVVRGRLTPEAGALLLRALEAARETLYPRARGAETATPD